VVFLYGSQSGTAEMYATEMSEEAAAYGMSSRATDLSEYDYEGCVCVCVRVCVCVC
jgi:sulfite reductase alpha subunit-like flavoprotein